MRSELLMLTQPGSQSKPAVLQASTHRKDADPAKSLERPYSAALCCHFAYGQRSCYRPQAQSSLACFAARLPAPCLENDSNWFRRSELCLCTIRKVGSFRQYHDKLYPDINWAYVRRQLHCLNRATARRIIHKSGSSQALTLPDLPYPPRFPSLPLLTLPNLLEY